VTAQPSAQGDVVKPQADTPRRSQSGGGESAGRVTAGEERSERSARHPIGRRASTRHRK
jgi:hypothetical protein